jgi:hypothetical protein
MYISDSVCESNSVKNRVKAMVWVKVKTIPMKKYGSNSGLRPVED